MHCPISPRAAATLLAATAATLATPSLPAQTTTTGTLTHDGAVRDYRLFLPAGYDADATAFPLVLNLHGITSNAAEQQAYSRMDAFADTAGYVVCYPNGLPIDPADPDRRQWAVGFPDQPATDDVGFLTRLVDTLVARYGLDPDRVYACGMSNGGFMSYALACAAPEKFAAIGSVTGGMVPGLRARCDAAEPVPVMQIHGTADGTVYFRGRPGVNDPIDTTVAFWARRDGCAGAPVTTAIPDDAADGFTSTRTVYADCARDTRVEYLVVEGGGHSWPGAPVAIAPTTQDFAASRELLRFFGQFARADSTSPVGGVGSGFRESGLLEAWPNPGDGHAVHLHPTDAARTFTMSNAGGQALAELTLPAGASRLPLGDLPAGGYLLVERGGATVRTARVLVR